jgi:glutamine cyclotransferase
MLTAETPDIAQNRVLDSAKIVVNTVAKPQTLPPASNAARRLTYKVLASHPHDTRAFTQGLLWYKGGFYESTGLEGQSSLRRVEFPSGRVVQQRALPNTVFAEGLALTGDELVQLTWKNQRAFVFDRATLRPLRELSYKGEGWGLAFHGRHL